jgi:hypothetical protein
MPSADMLERLPMLAHTMAQHAMMAFVAPAPRMIAALLSAVPNKGPCHRKRYVRVCSPDDESKAGHEGPLPHGLHQRVGRGT